MILQAHKITDILLGLQTSDSTVSPSFFILLVSSYCEGFLSLLYMSFSVMKSDDFFYVKCKFGDPLPKYQTTTSKLGGEWVVQGGSPTNMLNLVLQLIFGFRTLINRECLSRA